MNKLELIKALTADTQKVQQEARDLFLLDEKVLIQRPAVDSWSALECIEHLNVADSHYLIQFDEKLKKATRSTNNEFRPGLFGNYFVYIIRPRPDGTIPSPMKTLRRFRPEVNVHYDTKSRFLQDQDKLIEILMNCNALDLNKVKIPSAIGSIVTFKLGDALRFLVGHNQRHIIQAQHAIKTISKS